MKVADKQTDRHTVHTRIDTSTDTKGRLKRAACEPRNGDVYTHRVTCPVEDDIL